MTRYPRLGYPSSDPQVRATQGARPSLAAYKPARSFSSGSVYDYELCYRTIYFARV